MDNQIELLKGDGPINPIIESLIGVANQVAGQFVNCNRRFSYLADDLQAEAQYALVKTCKYIRNGRDSIATENYLKRAIWTKLIDYCRQEYPTISLNTDIDIEEIPQQPKIEIAATAMQKAALQLRLAGETFSATAEKLNVTSHELYALLNELGENLDDED